MDGLLDQKIAKASRQELENAVALLKRLDEKRKSEKLEHYAPYDFQKRFHHAEGFNTPGVLASQRALIAANQIGKCVTIDSYIDRPNGYRSTVKELLKLGEAFSVIAWNENRKVDAMAFPVFKKKKKEPCVRLWMASGHWIECALEHRILSSQGSYVHVLDLVSSVPILRDSNLEYGPSIRVEDAPRWKKIGIGFLADCLEGFRLCDARLHGVRGIVQSAFQRLSDALQCSSASFVLDGYWSKCTNTYLPTFDRLSSQDVCRRFEARFVGWLSHAFDKFFQLLSENIVKVQRFSIAGVDRLQPSFVTPQRQVSPASSESINEGNRIISYELIGLKDVYDFEVPQWHTYCAAGMVHHNTRCGSMEIAMHLTGNYPKWWKGQRFIRPIDCLVASNTNETTRDICQDALFGDPSNDEMLGTGAIPKRCIGETTSKPGVPNAFDTVLVKHTSGGWSKVQFKAYEQGFKKFMGRPRDVNWLDEEPPQDIWSQIVRGTFARKDSVILVTLTPEEGLTEVVRQFLEQLKDGQALVRATWDDAPHMTPEMRANKLASIPEREREMRSKGVPLMGAGIVFPFPDEEIVIDPIPIPRHWPQIIGVDFGFNHPFAACNVAWDRDADVIYITADYRSSLTTPAIHAASVRPWGHWKPIAWPHDGLNTEKGTGVQLKRSYEDEGLLMLPWRATNPPQVGQKEGEGGNSVEAAILEMFNRFETGRLKVFKTCRFWLEEKSTYHRDKKAQIVKMYDDTISASRYAIMMIRHARVETIKRRPQPTYAGASNW